MVLLSNPVPSSASAVTLRVPTKTIAIAPNQVAVPVGPVVDPARGEAVVVGGVAPAVTAVAVATVWLWLWLWLLWL